jgi:hypothetical protein
VRPPRGGYSEDGKEAEEIRQRFIRTRDHNRATMR